MLSSLLEHLRELRQTHTILATLKMASNDVNSRSPDSRPAGFPINPEDFDADSRISFSKLDNKFILEADDGQEFEFDNALKRWVPAVRVPPPSLRVYAPADHVSNRAVDSKT